jgi:ankyrin repeat domain-containing protein 50
MEAVGIVSLGLQVCGGLLKYYESWKDCEKDVAATHESLSGLERTFNFLKNTIQDQALSQDIVGHVEQGIVSCEDGVKSLKKRLDKVWASKVPDGLPAKVFRRALYPFKESTLAKMREAVRDLKDNLALSLNALQM